MEEDLLDYINSKHVDIVDKIKEEKNISDEISGELKDIIKEFVKMGKY